MNFKELLQDWTDWDIAGFKLGQSLGLFVNEDFNEHKYRFWTNDPLGHALVSTLMSMFEHDLLEYNNVEHQFKWKENAS